MLNRRHMLYAGTAATAGLAGAGLAWWMSQPGQRNLPAPAEPAGDFWSLVFDTPDGRKLPMQSFAGNPLLVNFWATWCPPCVEELPLLNSFYLQNKAKGWQVLGLAVDQPNVVRAWLDKSPLAFTVAMAGMSGIELSRSLGNAARGLPFSVVFGRSGQPIQRKSGQLTPQDLAAWTKL